MGLAINTAEPGDAVDKCNGPMVVMVDQIFTFLERRPG
ncbi:NADPH-dependent oxidoreductase, partial [Escherichia coli]|nr:NADPH-dependent oxidoreductase [Escherichia coli]